MRRPRKNPPRPGPAAMDGGGKGLMADLGYVRCKVHVQKPKGPRVDPEPRFIVRHQTPAETARERAAHRERQRLLGVPKLKAAS